MTFKITKEYDESGTLLRIDGELTSEGLGELGRVCEETTKPLRISVSNLSVTDDPVIEAFRQMIRDGVKFEDASPYLSIRLFDQNINNN